MITFFAAVMMFGIHMWVPVARLTLEHRKPIAMLWIICGAALAIAGIVQFAKAKTTIHPLEPQKANVLVVHGIYRHTRNPMYLGLVLVLIGWGIALSNAAGFVVIPLFMWYMTVFQIKPEEAALQEKFGESFSNYCQHVRRWV